MSDYLSVLISANLISTGGVPELSHVWSLPREVTTEVLSELFIEI